MKKIIISIIVFVSINCVAQKPIMLTLQQIEFKDSILTKTLFDILQSNDCFREKDFYVLDFFRSSLSDGEYYLSINEFFADEKTYHLFAYFAEINNITFFVSNRVSSEIFQILPTKKHYSFQRKENPYAVIGADYNFLIWRTLSGYYYVLLQNCGE